MLIPPWVPSSLVQLCSSPAKFSEWFLLNSGFLLRRRLPGRVIYDSFTQGLSPIRRRSHSTPDKRSSRPSWSQRTEPWWSRATRYSAASSGTWCWSSSWWSTGGPGRGWSSSPSPSSPPRSRWPRQGQVPWVIIILTRRSILGSDGMTKSDCSLSFWLLFKYCLSAFWVLSECLLNALWDILKSSWS